MTQDEPDRRPRPQYGEYATPQEQRAHVRQPSPTPPVTPPPAPADRVRPSGPPWPADRPKAPAAGRIIALILLAYGAVNVALSIPSFLNLAPALTRAYRMVGVPGSFTNVDGARTWGVVAVIVLVVGFLLTAWLTLRALRRGRSAWWLPIAGAAVTYIVVFICMSVPLLGDPAFTAYLQNAR